MLAFVADEEAGGSFGARWLVESGPDLFDGCTDAMGEVGGFSYSASPTKTVYLVETAQKGMAWMHLTAAGRSGHGSAAQTDNPIPKLAEAIARITIHTFPGHDNSDYGAFFRRHGNKDRSRQPIVFFVQARSNLRMINQLSAIRPMQLRSSVVIRSMLSPLLLRQRSMDVSCQVGSKPSFRRLTPCSGLTLNESGSCSTKPSRPTRQPHFSTTSRDHCVSRILERMRSPTCFRRALMQSTLRASA